MKKRELVSVVSKIMGFVFAVEGLGQLLTIIPVVQSTFQHSKSGMDMSGVMITIGVITAMLVYFFGVFWLLIAKADKISTLVVKDSENTDVNIGIGKDGLQQVLFFGLGIYLCSNIIYIVANGIVSFRYGFSGEGNFIISGVKLLSGLALIIWCGPISRWTDRLYVKVKNK